MQSEKIRKKFLDFFAKKGHTIIPSAPLVPENDPSTLFTTAGMHPLIPYLLGEPHPAGRRLVSIQKCLRTIDIDEVGDITHLTFFEMLGNWSLGDYFKKDSIAWSFEFLTKEMGLDPDRISVTCFAGDDDAPKDEEAAQIWQSVDIPPDRIFFYGKEHNWWIAGESGPCGPDTEIFYDLQPDQPTTDPASDEGRYIEIWNNVFMQYNKTIAGRYEPLSQTNVDTGLGFERLVMFMQGVNSPYETDLFQPIMEVIDRHAKNKDDRAKRIIADHLRTAIFLLAEKVVPSNIDQGYVLRRIIRRTVRFMRLLEVKDEIALIEEVYKAIIKKYTPIYPELAGPNEKFIYDELKAEYEKFQQAVTKGMKEFEKNLAKINKIDSSEKRTISGHLAFKLYDTYGFPIEMTIELAAEHGIEVDRVGFDQAFVKHQELSRQGSEQKFKGGLADHSEITTAYHSLTHLLHAALRHVLGKHVEQRGSNINADRLRFDFSHPDKMTPEQINQVENWVNQAIAGQFEVKKEEMSKSDALTAGAIGLFHEKYGERVSVYTMYNPQDNVIYSREICGGPHIKNFTNLGKFKIIKEESSSAGIRRIKAILE